MVHGTPNRTGPPTRRSWQPSGARRCTIPAGARAHLAATCSRISRSHFAARGQGRQARSSRHWRRAACSHAGDGTASTAGRSVPPGRGCCAAPSATEALPGYPSPLSIVPGAALEPPRAGSCPRSPQRWPGTSRWPSACSRRRWRPRARARHRPAPIGGSRSDASCRATAAGSARLGLALPARVARARRGRTGSRSARTVPGLADAAGRAAQHRAVGRAGLSVCGYSAAGGARLDPPLQVLVAAATGPRCSATMRRANSPAGWARPRATRRAVGSSSSSGCGSVTP